jgi:ABC-type microcin C transport system permease subunit YejB
LHTIRDIIWYDVRKEIHMFRNTLAILLVAGTAAALFAAFNPALFREIVISVAVIGGCFMATIALIALGRREKR